MKFALDDKLHAFGIFIFRLNIVLFWPLVFVAAEYNVIALKLYLTFITVTSFGVIPCYPFYLLYKSMKDWR